MSEKPRNKFKEWQQCQSRPMNMQPYVSTIPCSLLSDNLDESSDTPIKLIMYRDQSGKIRSPDTTQSKDRAEHYHAKTNRNSKNRDSQDLQSSRECNPQRLSEQNRRLKAELEKVHSLLSEQTLQSQQYCRKLRLKNLQDELNKLDTTSTKKDSLAKLTRELHGLKVANHELTAKNDQLTHNLKACQELLTQTENKLQRKKELIKSKDQQLRRYVALVDELRADYKPKERERDKQTHRKHHRQPSNSRQLQNSNSNLNRHQSLLAVGEFSSSLKQQTQRQSTSTKPMLKSLGTAGQLSRLWSGTLAKTTRNTSRIK